jgi:diguanylate cyclase (GGDEF)-like protein
VSHLVDHLVELTGFRDRDRLDVTLVGAIRDLLRPNSVAVWGAVGEPGQERWFRRAELGATDIAATSDVAWTDFELLPRLADHPLRQKCLASQQVVLADGPPAVCLFPLANEIDAGGVLEIVSDKPFASDMRNLVTSILRIYHNFQALLDYSERDTLTGLLNRKTFDESFLKATISAEGEADDPARATDGRRALGRPHGVYLGVVDIDHFKSVNDRFGHLIGDEVLLLLSRLMRSTFRFGDRLYRFGGEEFVVMMRCADVEDALGAFERLRDNAQRYVFPQVGQITVSVGFTEVQRTDTPSAAFQRADTAVYYAKDHGRNQVCNHATLVEQGAIKSDTAKTGDVELF